MVEALPRQSADTFTLIQSFNHLVYPCDETVYLYSKVVGGFILVPYKVRLYSTTCQNIEGDIPYCIPSHIIGGRVPSVPPVSAPMSV